MLNRWLWTAANNPAADFLVSLLERLDISSAPVLRVLTYHRVADSSATPHLYPRITVSPPAFARQMDLIRRRYRVVSMEEVAQSVRTGERLPKRAVLVTFDDAYRDFAENALPVLRRYQIPATLFVPTAFPGNPQRTFWWDRLYAVIQQADPAKPLQTPVGRLPVQTGAQRRQAFSRLRDYVKSTPHQAAMAWVDQFCQGFDLENLTGSVLTWEELRLLAQEGISLGAHTRTHPMMNQISSADARSEAAGSRQDLRDQTGEVLPIFAYPSGGYTREVIQILAEEGFQLAFTTQRGISDFQQPDHLEIKRINVGPKTSLALLRAQMLSGMRFVYIR